MGRIFIISSLVLFLLFVSLKSHCWKCALSFTSNVLCFLSETITSFRQSNLDTLADGLRDSRGRLTAVSSTVILFGMHEILNGTSSRLGIKKVSILLPSRREGGGG